MKFLTRLIGLALVAFGTFATFVACNGSYFRQDVFLMGAGSFAVGLFLNYCGGRKQCPSCAESIKVDAKKCKFCGFEFN